MGHSAIYKEIGRNARNRYALAFEWNGKWLWDFGKKKGFVGERRGLGEDRGRIGRDGVKGVGFDYGWEGYGLIKLWRWGREEIVSLCFDDILLWVCEKKRWWYFMKIRRLELE